MATADGVLIDTGPLVAILNERDQYHATCRVASEQLRGPFYTCWPVITEAAFLLKERVDIVEILLERIRSGRIALCALGPGNAGPISRILSQYADQSFDLADAALMHLAERESTPKMFTIDHRHFSVYRTSGGKPLSMVPAAG